MAAAPVNQSAESEHVADDMLKLIERLRSDLPVETLRRLVEDAIWLKNFVRSNTGLTGHDWAARARAEKHYADIMRVAATARALNTSEG